MKETAQKKVAIFVCHDVTGLLIVNHIVPKMIEMGLSPVLFNTSMQRNRVFKIPTPPVVAFFNAVLTNDVLIPLLERSEAHDSINTSYKGLSHKFGVEYYDITDVNDHKLQDFILSDDSFIGGMAIRFLQVFEDPIINLFHQKGFMWNLHSGLLPKYKGLLTPYRAIQNGDKTYGMTLHDLTAGIDEGDILAKAELPLNSKRPIFDLYLDLVPHGAEIILNTLLTYLDGGDIRAASQERVDKKNYFTNPTSQEFREFMARGIVFANPFDAVQRLISLFARKNSMLERQLRDGFMGALQNGVQQSVVEERRSRNRA
jgi:methionyl-tRNA formyltransferase